MRLEIPYKNGVKGISRVYDENRETTNRKDKIDGEKIINKDINTSIKDIDVELYYNSYDDEILVLKSTKEPVNGIVCSYYNNGNVSVEYPYKDGKKEGVQRSYYESGRLESEAHYNNDKVEGIVNLYYESGKLQGGVHYKGNKKEGISKEYYENGRLKCETPYKGDKVDGIKRTYRENGKLESETFYENDKKEGISRLYYENGQIQTEGTYKNDKVDGYLRMYRESGELKSETPHKNGKEEGYQRIYNSAGQAMKILYKNGEPVSAICEDGRTLTRAELINLINGQTPQKQGSGCAGLFLALFLFCTFLALWCLTLPLSFSS